MADTNPNDFFFSSQNLWMRKLEDLTKILLNWFVLSRCFRPWIIVRQIITFPTLNYPALKDRNTFYPAAETLPQTLSGQTEVFFKLKPSFILSQLFPRKIISRKREIGFVHAHASAGLRGVEVTQGVNSVEVRTSILSVETVEINDLFFTSLHHYHNNKSNARIGQKSSFRVNFFTSFLRLITGWCCCNEK